MKVLPILFNTEMVQAILDGRKTTTRRVIKPQPPQSAILVMSKNPDVLHAYDEEIEHPGMDRRVYMAPYRPGDILYVRETWSTRQSNYCYFQPCHGGICPHESCDLADGPCFPDEYIYKATDILPGYGGKWRPSIHMPKEAARIFLRVTDVRVEPLREIGETGAAAEGLYKGWRLCGRGSLALSARQAFMWLWIYITRNSPAADSWACNPWVWVITFERCEKPWGFAN